MPVLDLTLPPSLRPNLELTQHSIYTFCSKHFTQQMHVAVCLVIEFTYCALSNTASITTFYPSLDVAQVIAI